MKINIDDLSREELRNLMKPLSIETLRVPVKENAKLEKKYITGFRASSVTYVQLVPLYFHEVHNGNKDVERVLLRSIKDYLNARELCEQIESLASDQEWKNCVQMGIKLGNAMCEIDFAIICKIYLIDMPEEKVETIALICSQICEQHKNVTNTTSEHEKEKHELEVQIERAAKEKISLEEKWNFAIKLRDESDKELKRCSDLLKQANAICGKQETTIKENETELKKKSSTINDQEQSLKEYKDKIAERDTQIKDLKKRISDIEKELSEKNNEKITEYNLAIEKLVVDTIEDLKVNYSLDVEQFDDIIKSLDGENNILEIWNRLSEINANIISDIEAAMRSNIVNTDIIDQCDDVENNILVKYVILKSIKSLYFEYLSMSEKKANISDKIFTKIVGN